MAKIDGADYVKFDRYYKYSVVVNEVNFISTEISKLFNIIDSGRLTHESTRVSHNRSLKDVAVVVPYSGRQFEVVYFWVSSLDVRIV